MSDNKGESTNPPTRPTYTGQSLPIGRGRRIKSLKAMVNNYSLMADALTFYVDTFSEISAKIHDLYAEDPRERDASKKIVNAVLAGADWSYNLALDTEEEQNDLELYMQWLDDIIDWNTQSKEPKVLQTRLLAAQKATELMNKLSEKSSNEPNRHDESDEDIPADNAMDFYAQQGFMGSDGPDNQGKSKDSLDLHSTRNMGRLYSYKLKSTGEEKGEFVLNDILISALGPSTKVALLALQDPKGAAVVGSQTKMYLDDVDLETFLAEHEVKDLGFEDGDDEFDDDY